MAGSKFQYDESGGTFFYFLLSFFALLLIPASYYFWPKSAAHEEQQQSRSSRKCHCELCQLKQNKLTSKEPQKKTKQKLTKILIVVGWLAFFAVAYKVAHLERDYVDWDPFEILQIDRGSSQAEIKRAYRKLSLIYHPDKDTGDAKKFLQLTKAHAALTDDEARKNWEMYGNPDGPGAMSFGIALPSWIVEKENSLWVLGLYALVFMVTLPIAVAIWWRRSIKFSEDQVLLGTKQMYYYFVTRTPLMNVKRIIMVLAASLEFYKYHNNEIVERPTDNVEIPKIMKEFSNFGEKNKEVPLCYAYSIKARALIFAHLSRLELNQSTIGNDKAYAVKKCPFLVNAIVLSIYQILTLALSGHVREMPKLETLENCMKLSPMIVQALWEHKSPLLQLPHVTEDMLRYFTYKSRPIRNVSCLVGLKESERRHVLRSLTDEEYEDVMAVCEQMPHVHMKAKAEVLGDVDPSTITAGAVVTVTVSLKRDNLAKVFMREGGDRSSRSDNVFSNKDEETENKKNKVQKRGKGGGGGVGGGGGSSNNKQLNHVKKHQNQNSVEKSSRNRSESSSLDSDSELDSNGNLDSAAQLSDADDDDDEHLWKATRVIHGKKDKSIEAKSRISHTVHCPLFPEEKQEYWWLYVVDVKFNYIMTAPHHITDLVDEAEVQLKFPAPEKVGVRSYSVHLRSDSYVDSDVSLMLKLNVKAAKEIPPEDLKYGISEDEKEEEEDGSKLSCGSSDEDAVAISDDEFSDSD